MTIAIRPRALGRCLLLLGTVVTLQCSTMSASWASAKDTLDSPSEANDHAALVLERQPSALAQTSLWRRSTAFLPLGIFALLLGGFALLEWRRLRRLPLATLDASNDPSPLPLRRPSRALALRQRDEASVGADGLQFEAPVFTVLAFSPTQGAPRCESLEASALPRQCPQCERVFDGTASYCVFDGVALERLYDELDENERLDKACGCCGALFDEEQERCPDHDLPLVHRSALASLPAEGRRIPQRTDQNDGEMSLSLRQRLGAAPDPSHPSEPMHEQLVCPSCAQRFDHSLSYCPNDGTALTMLM